MKRLKTLTGLLLASGVANFAAASSPIPMDPPTPPPCAADGTCYPRTAEWGYYPVRWRTWPGAGMEPTPSSISPTPADRRVSDELGHSEPPPAELEDAAAPPSSPKREAPQTETPPPPGDAPADGGAAPESTSSPDSSFPDVPLPDDENDLFGPTSELDPPPALPYTFGEQQRAQRTRQAAALPRRSATAPRVSTTDPPPAPPWAQSAAL